MKYVKRNYRLLKSIIEHFMVCVVYVYNIVYIVIAILALAMMQVLRFGIVINYMNSSSSRFEL